MTIIHSNIKLKSKVHKALKSGGFSFVQSMAILMEVGPLERFLGLME